MAGACFLAITPFFWRGNPSGHDFEFHLFSWMEVLGQWKHGIVYPRWAALAHWGYGEARFLFYPPASWTMGAILGAILPWTLVPGAYCWIALAGAAAAMYRLAREWLLPADAAFAAVFYALNPYHLLIVYWRSAYAELLAASLLPVVVLCLTRMGQTCVRPALGGEPCLPSERHSANRPALWLGMGLAAAWLTNEPAAVMIHYSAAGIALFLAGLAAIRDKAWAAGLGLLARTALAVALGVGLASFYLLPAIYEQHWVNLAEVLSPGVRPQDNFVFTATADPDHNRFNRLVSTLAIAEAGTLALAIVLILRENKSRSIPGTTSASPDPTISALVATPPLPSSMLSVWGALAVFLTLSVSHPIWELLPKLRFVQLPFRWLLCLNAALAVLVTAATRRWTLRALALVLLTALLICAGLGNQPPWWDTAADIREMADAMADGTGNEGTEEYVPTGADASELDKTAPLISIAGDEPVAAPANILRWAATDRHFIVSANQAERLQLRLFNYPAWRVQVNGRATLTQTADVTGQMIIPIQPGVNDVRVQFETTPDRTFGAMVSGVSLCLLALAWVKMRRQPTFPLSTSERTSTAMPAHVLLATSNPGKLRDFAGAAAPFGIEIQNLPNFASLPPVVEDGLTFEENALKKAEGYSLAVPGELVVADDSGLEIDALSGAPGVHSARYAADEPHAAESNTDDEANNAKVLRELAGIPDAERTARFVCVLAVARDGRMVQGFRGTAEGVILHTPRGDQGFGYDPLFYFPQIGKTFAELNATEKAQFSHRGRAFRAFLEWYRARQ